MKMCSIDGCKERHCANGYCRTHNYRFKRYGNTTTFRQVQAKGVTKGCLVDGCNNKHQAKGYCKKHHYRFIKHGDPLHTPYRDKCSIDGCNDPHYGKGYCRTHYSRWKHNGDPLITKIKYNTTCQIEACNSKSRKNGYCEEHYLKSDLGRMVSRLSATRRRSRKLKAPINDFVGSDWNDALEYFNSECAYCGNHKKDLHQDHVVPLSKSGSNTKTNIIPACPTCNNNKKARLLEEWYHKKEFYSREREGKILKWMGYKVIGNNIQLQLI